MTNMINPSEVDTDTDVSADLFNETDGDYNSETWDRPPKLSVNPQRSISLGADRVEFQTIWISDTVNRRAVQLVPGRGNNERKRITIVPYGGQPGNDLITLIANEDVPMFTFVNGVPVASVGYMPWTSSLAPFVYESAAPIWAVIGTTTGIVCPVCVMTESYFPEGC